MCYIVAKKFDEVGSIALRMEHGLHLSSLSKYLTISTLDSNIQIVTVSDLDSYQEYTPYKVLSDELDFIKEVFKWK